MTSVMTSELSAPPTLIFSADEDSGSSGIVEPRSPHPMENQGPTEPEDGKTAGTSSLQKGHTIPKKSTTTTGSSSSRAKSGSHRHSTMKTSSSSLHHSSTNADGASSSSHRKEGEVVYRRMKSPPSERDKLAASYYGSMYLGAGGRPSTPGSRQDRPNGKGEGGGTASYLGHREMDVDTAVAMAGYTYPYNDAVLNPYRRGPAVQKLDGQRTPTSNSHSSLGSNRAKSSSRPGASLYPPNRYMDSSRSPSRDGRRSKLPIEEDRATSYGNPQRAPGPLSLLDQTDAQKSRGASPAASDNGGAESDEDDIYHFRSDPSGTSPAKEGPGTASPRRTALTSVGSGTNSSGQGRPSNGRESRLQSPSLYLPRAARTSAATYRREVSARKGIPQPPHDFSRTLPKTTKVFRGEVVDDRPEWRPGLGHTFKRGWQDFCLGLRFWWFRTRRKAIRMVERH